MFDRATWMGGGVGQTLTADFEFPPRALQRIWVFLASGGVWEVNLPSVKDLIALPHDGHALFIIVNHPDSSNSLHIKRFPPGGSNLVRTIQPGKAVHLGIYRRDVENRWAAPLHQVHI